MSCKPSLKHRLLTNLTLLTGGSLAFAGLNIYNGNATFYKDFLMPIIHTFTDAENAHVLAVKLAKHGFVPKAHNNDEKAKILRTQVWGKSFDNPLGLAAGFDKDAEALSGLSKMGFGFVEVGSVTPLPQDGNAKPRVFRLIEDKAIINRYGFNSSGHQVVKQNLENFWRVSDNNSTPIIVGVNLGKNKLSSEESDQDYLDGLELFSKYPQVGYFVINISSPNTPGLRRMQGHEQFKRLLDAIASLKSTGRVKQPVLIKIAPDLSYEERSDIAKLILQINKNKKVIDGIIVSNTTISRPCNLQSSPEILKESGGLSGQPLNSISTKAISDMYQLTLGQVPIVGVGGIFNGQDAYDKIKAGASLVQLYTSLAFNGPPVVSSVKNELIELLTVNGYESVAEAVGTDHKK